MTSSNSKPPRRRSEFAMIAELFAPLSEKAPGAFGLTDDAATVSLAPGDELVVTVDALVEGVHFLRDDPPGTIAKKSLRVNLSDLAAKGATPRNYLLSMSLPDWVSDNWLTTFATGLREDQEKFGIDLLGGDTTSTPGPLMLSITALGAVPRGCMTRRTGAKPGDAVFVSGTIGDAGGGLALLKGQGETLSPNARDALIARYRLPEPRLTLGRSLVGVASAALDVSDGLIADSGHIAKQSRVRIVVEAPRIPLSSALAELWGRDARAVTHAATSGDDYEIAFTAPKSARAAIAKAAKNGGVTVHEIGWVEEGSGVVLLDEKGVSISVARPGFTHF